MSTGRNLYTVLLIASSIAFVVIVSAAVTGDISLAGVGRTLLWLAAAAVIGGRRHTSEGRQARCSKSGGAWAPPQQVVAVSNTSMGGRPECNPPAVSRTGN